MAHDTRLEWAAALAHAFENGHLVGRVPDAVIADVDAARALQAAARERIAWPIVGWKVGATSAGAQRLLATDAPFFGPLFGDRLWSDGDVVTLPAGFLGFECEFALRIGASLPPRPGGYAVAALKIAIDAVVPAIELVATRQRRDAPGDVRCATADFGYAYGLVAGRALMPPPLEGLAGTAVTARVDGEEVGRGTGADVLGQPLEVLAWLTREGVALRAGDIVSTGTCTGLGAVAPGQRATADFGPLGEVAFVAG